MRSNLPLILYWIGFVFLVGCASGGDNLLSIPESISPLRVIAFTSERDGNREIYLIQPNGTELTRLTNDPSVDSDPAWSPDGARIAFRSRRSGSSDNFIMGADGSTPINIVNDRPDRMDDEFSPAWHPEGSILMIYTDRFLPPMGDCRGSLGVHHLAFIRLDVKKPVIQHFDDLAGEQSSPP